MALEPPTTVSSYKGSFNETNCAQDGKPLIDPETGKHLNHDLEVCKICGKLFCYPECWDKHKQETHHRNVI